jgi:hypothetical protein
MPVMPVRDLLLGMTGAHEQRFLEMAAHKLKGERQALRKEAPGKVIVGLPDMSKSVANRTNPERPSLTKPAA